MFKFSNTDNKLISKDLSVFDEELNSSLKVSLPGLVLNTSGELSTLGAAGRSTGGEERLNSTEKHRLLVHANPFNVCVIFRPYIAFVTTVKDAIPASFIEEPESFGTFLDDFIAKVYLPRLEEKGTSLFQVAVSGRSAMRVFCEANLILIVSTQSGADAFEIDRTSGRWSPYPVVKVSIGLSRVVAYLTRDHLAVFHAGDDHHQQFLCHAHSYAIQQRRLQSTHYRCHYPVLPKM